MHFQPGDVVKTKDAPEAADTSAAEARGQPRRDEEAPRAKALAKGKAH